ncbi:helicase (DNA) b [Plakobranchus ocellatus]|uniref:Helicase (DNA) b n=1 Tax=Plakobranchus ocellatus TaxID=259542 RepID=A0AAV4A2N6_9GAST|nr:helicase (DNA) b [Plakobranchus ocellatus]
MASKSTSNQKPHPDLLKGYKEVTGTFIVPHRSLEATANDSSDDEDAEEGDVFLDYRDMHAGENMVRARVPSQSREELKDTAGKKHVCHGRFLMTQPYWEVTVKMNRTYLRSAPVYCLKSDWGAKSMNMVNIFLSDCLKALKKDDLENGTKACFESFCRNSGLHDCLTFAELEEILTLYTEKERSEGCWLKHSPQSRGGGLRPEDHSAYIKNHVLESELGSTVLAAASFPKLVKTLSGLFPYTFPQILFKLNKQCRKLQERYGEKVCDEDDVDEENQPKNPQKKLTPLQKADAMAQKSPWEFCFREIIIRNLHLDGIEASLQTYRDAGFLLITPQREKDAIYIYDVLKTDAKREGHMYMPFKILRGYYHFRKLDYQINGLKRWKLALDYLDTSGVVKREDFGGDTSIFIMRNWQAEVDSAEAVNQILNRHQREPFVWDVDMQSAEFKSMVTDEDQLKASVLICSTPVVVMSGRGGCGKTTVITQLLKHLCNRERNRLEDEERKKLNNAQQACETQLNDQKENSTWVDSVDEISSIKTETPNSVETLPFEVDCMTATKTPNKNRLGLENSLSGLSLSNHESKEGNEDGCELSAVSGKQMSEANNASTSECRASPSKDDPRHTPVEGHATEQSSKQGQTKAQLLKKELVGDLLKILGQCRDKDDPKLDEFKSKILLTAPTGKAARLLGCKAGFPSATLHSVLTSWQVFLQAGNAEGSWRYEQVETLVVDECSLVSVRLFANVAKILLTQANLRKLVLLGDVRQLPSIEPGDFLKDLFGTLSKLPVQAGETAVKPGQFSLAVELRHNHRSESELIVSNAELISSMKFPDFDSTRNFHMVKTQQCGDGGDNERDQAIRQLLKTKPDLSSHVNSQFVAFRNAHCLAINELCCRFYNNHSIKKPSQSGKKEKYDFRIGDKICLGKNNQVMSKHQVYLDKYRAEFPQLSEALNEEENRLKEALKKKADREEQGGSRSDHSPCSAAWLGAGQGEEMKDGLDVSKGGLDAYSVLGLLDQNDETFDTTISEMRESERARQAEKEARRQRARQQQQRWRQKWQGRSLKKDAIALLGKSSEKLCNGEVFFIMDEFEQFENDGNSGGVARPVTYFVLSDRDPELPRVVCVPVKQLRRECKMRHSWVRTIHTYQGSESDTVVYVVGPAIPQTWQHVYTAVTRGRKSVYVVGDQEQLHKAITRRDMPRRTRLRHRLSEKLTGQAVCVEMCQQEFLKRQSLVAGQMVKDEHPGLDEDEHLDFFDSDNTWFDLTISQKKHLTTEKISADLTSSTNLAGEKEQSFVGAQAKTDDLHKPEVKLVQTGAMEEGDSSKTCGNFWSAIHKSVELNWSSTSEEEEESIFAPLARYKKKQKVISQRQQRQRLFEAGDEIKIEEESSDDDLTPLPLTQLLGIEENLSCCKDESKQARESKSTVNERESRSASYDRGPSTSAVPSCVSEKVGSQRVAQQMLPSVSCEMQDNAIQSTKISTHLSLSSDVILNGLSKASPHLYSPQVETDTRNNSAADIRTPPKHSPAFPHVSPTEGDRSLPASSWRTPVKRSPMQRGPHEDDPEFGKLVSPPKMQRCVGSPFLKSFSDSLTFDAGKDCSDNHLDSVQEESPLHVKRKL